MITNPYMSLKTFLFQSIFAFGCKIYSIVVVLQILKHKISLLEASKMELQTELQECRIGYEHLSQRAIDAQVGFLLMSESSYFKKH